MFKTRRRGLQPIDLGHGASQTRIEICTSVSCTLDQFLLRVDLVAYEDNRCIFERHWDRSVPGDLVSPTAVLGYHPLCRE